MLLQKLEAVLALGSLAVATATPAQKHLEDDDDTPLPLIIWHGLGDNYAAEGLQEVGALANEVHPGTYTYFARTDDNANNDRSGTFFGNVTEQVAKVCADIAADPILSTAPAIDALGLSQGGLFLRGYIERCNKPPVRSLVTFGTPHNGISKFRGCEPSDWLCRGAMALLTGNTWSSFVQSRLVPAQYYRDPQQYDKYLEGSNFLADINNEREEKDTQYKANVAALESFVMFMFDEDDMIIPPESAWFEEVNGTEATPLRARDLYKEDWLGLRALDRKGGLHLKIAPGGHMTLSEELLTETFKKFYGPYGKSSAVDEVDEL